MHGVLSIGDSIGTGWNYAMRDIPSQGWPLWLANAMGTCHRRVSKGGATSGEILEQQLPLVTDRYEIGALSIGTNDVNAGLRDPDRFAENLDRIITGLRPFCGTIVIPTVIELRHPAAAAEANRMIRAQAASDVVIVDIADFRGTTLMRGDRVHPTTVGQITIADRACDALAGRIDIPRPTSFMPIGKPHVGYLCRYGYDRTRRFARDTAKKLLRR